MLGKLETIDSLGGSVVAVVFDGPERVRNGLLRGLDVPFPILVDERRDAYRSWGMGRASVARVWLDPRVWGRYAGLLLRGNVPIRTGKDTLQLGGDFVVDPAGVVTYSRPQVRDDRPAVSTLLDEIERASRR